MLDLDAISAKWLGVCGACDAGVGMCSHPSEDYRPVMLRLVEEIKLLYGITTAEIRDEIEVQTSGLRYPCSDMAAAWREFGALKADGYDTRIVTRTVVFGPWRAVSDAPA